jgi:hypothetical protein
VIETDGAADGPGVRAVSEKDGFSLVPTSPSRRAFEVALGSDNRSSSCALGSLTRATVDLNAAALTTARAPASQAGTPA